MRKVIMYAVTGWMAAVSLAAPARSADAVVLDEKCWWRRYYRFSRSRYSPALLKSVGPKVLGRGFGRFRRDIERMLKASGVDLRKVDWRDHAYCAMRGARAFNPFPAPPPPKDWTAAGFDDSAWVRESHPFQGVPIPQIKNIVLGQYREDVDLRLRAAYYRGRFHVGDPARAGALRLRLVYAGGVRAFINGHEIARGHLPKGDLTPDTPAEHYPAQAYRQKDGSLARRTISLAEVPARHLRKGVNVLAVEVRASDFHPIVATNPKQPNWGGPQRPWPHARLISVELRPASRQVPSVARRPAGTVVWVEDVHHRVTSSDWPPFGEGPGTVRFVGARNGTYAAQIAVSHGAGSAGPLTELRGRVSDLRQVSGAGRIPAAAIRVLHVAPFPLSEWTMGRLGDERGLAASFPSQKELERHLEVGVGSKAAVFDRLVPLPSVSVPVGTTRPVWLSLRVPADASPGRYSGTVEVTAAGRALATLPVEAEVVGWALPEPKGFSTFVGCEQNPYGVAKQYGAALWSDRHFKLMEPSFKQLARVGNQWLNVPALVNTEFGNKDDSMIRWARGRNGAWAFDYTVLDKYLDLAMKHWGRPKVIHFIVMQGMKTADGAPHKIKFFDEASRKSSLFAITPTLRPVWPPRGKAPLGPEQRRAWKAFATSLHSHLRRRGLAKSMYWGAPWEVEANPDLKTHLAACAPGVFWTAGPHEMMANGIYAKNERFYKIVTDIRYHGRWPSFRDDQGWRSRTLHLLNPRVGGTAMAIHTTSHPFAYRVMVDRALALGRSGFGRVGADEWAGIHYEGMEIPRWLTGIPVLFLLWPGPNGAEPSTRFEMLLEGIQETEARIFIERALDRRRLPQALAGRARSTLRRHFEETNFWQGNSIIRSMEQYHCRWQERSSRLYRLAAEVARHVSTARR